MLRRLVVPEVRLSPGRDGERRGHDGGGEVDREEVHAGSASTRARGSRCGRRRRCAGGGAVGRVEDGRERRDLLVDLRDGGEHRRVLEQVARVDARGEAVHKVVIDVSRPRSASSTPRCAGRPASATWTRRRRSGPSRAPCRAASAARCPCAGPRRGGSRGPVHAGEVAGAHARPAVGGVDVARAHVAPFIYSVHLRLAGADAAAAPRLSATPRP